MGRVWKSWTPQIAAEANVAEHRYKWDGAVNGAGERVGDIDLAETYAAAKKCFPYEAGEVIYIDAGTTAVRAKIIHTFWERDFAGFRKECYKVVRETKKGQWSKLWEVVHPAFIQRGYYKAGLAPDLEGKL